MLASRWHAFDLFSASSEYTIRHGRLARVYFAPPARSPLCCCKRLSKLRVIPQYKLWSAQRSK